MATNYKQCKHCAGELTREHGPVFRCPVILARIPTGCNYCGSPHHTATRSGRGSETMCPALLKKKAATKAYLEARRWWNTWGAKCDAETLRLQMEVMPQLRNVLKQKGVQTPETQTEKSASGFDALQDLDQTELNNLEDEKQVEDERQRKAEMVRLKATKVAPKKKKPSQKEKRLLQARDAKLTHLLQKMLQRSQTEASTLLSETFEALVTATQQAKDLEDTKAVTARMAELKRQYGLNRKMTKQVKKIRPAAVVAFTAGFGLAEMA